MTCSTSSHSLIESAQDLLFYFCCAAVLITLAILASMICALLMLRVLLKRPLTRLRNLLKRTLKMKLKPKPLLSLTLTMLLASALLLTGCGTDQPLVAAPCPKPPSVPRALMQPPANSAELAKILSSTPTP